MKPMLGNIEEAFAGGASVPKPGSAEVEGAAQIEEADVDLGAIIGVGGFATVHEALWRGVRVAVKVWDLSPPPPRGNGPGAAGTAGERAAGFAGISGAGVGASGGALGPLVAKPRTGTGLRATGRGQKQSAQAASAQFAHEVSLLIGLRHPVRPSVPHLAPWIALAKPLNTLLFLHI